MNEKLIYESPALTEFNVTVEAGFAASMLYEIPGMGDGGSF